MQKYYDILGVSAQSSQDEVKSAYRQLARKYHPDVYGDEHMFRAVTEAYEALVHASPPPPPKPKPQTPPKDVFLKSGEDIHADITISVKEAVVGTQRTVNIMQSKQCPGCTTDECKICQGTGEMLQHKKINVKIPANIQSGHKLRIKGEGSLGSPGAPNGDLYLTIHIEGGSRFKYDGANVLYSLGIRPHEAVLGTVAVIPGFNGEIHIEIPPMTNSGQTFTLSGQGGKDNGKSGDLIVTVHIEIPSSLSQDEIRLYKKLEKLNERKRKN